jgi:hypothetical protein
MPLSDDQRRLQSERIRQTKPWLNSTGPRTPEGKARSSRNADKGSERPKLRALAKALRRIERQNSGISQGFPAK